MGRFVVVLGLVNLVVFKVGEVVVFLGVLENIILWVVVVVLVVVRVIMSVLGVVLRFEIVMLNVRLFVNVLEIFL